MHLRRIVESENLPEGIMERAERFFLAGDLNQLFELPIDTDEMIEASKVLMSAPSIRQYAKTSEQSEPRVYPTFSESLRSCLLRLVHEGSEHAEAALFLLSHDLRARACNSVVQDAAN
mgnify:CR=1 FL=1